MARGWESKSVEAQIESTESQQRASNRPHPTMDQVEAARKKNGLLLARTRVMQELSVSQHPRYRDMLNRALADLDAQLAQIE
jgi:hypothetical protein